MNHESLDRRSFTKLTVAAFGGLLTGAAGTRRARADVPKQDDEPEINVDPRLLLEEPHVCRGLNTCEGMGAGEDNACAGQGNCATVEAHTCRSTNACEGQGGCGGYPGQNTCDGKGHCAVPLGEETWAIARKQFEHLMGEIDQNFADAPPAG